MDNYVENITANNSPSYNQSMKSSLTHEDVDMDTLMRLFNQVNQVSYRNQIIVTDFYGLLITSVLGIITNTLVIATFIACWRFWRNSTRLLLLTLACVDIVGNGVCFVNYLLSIPKLNPYSIDFPTPIYLYLNNGFKRLSFLMMIPISINRYALICRPFTHHAITSQKSALIQTTALTVFALTTNLYELYFFQISWIMYKICLLIINVILSVILPLIVTFVLTVLVTCEFRRINRTLEDSASSETASRQGERNMTIAMIGVNMAFIILILPSVILRVTIFFRFELDTYVSYILIWLNILCNINFSINLFIYILCLPKFRSTLLGLLTCKSCRRRRNESFELPVV